MRIAVLTSSYPRFKGDGIAPFVQSISEALSTRGHRVQVLAPHDIDVRQNPDSKIKVHRFKYAWSEKTHVMGHARSLKADVKLRPIILLLLPLFLLAEIFNLIRLCRKMKAQVIHAHWVLPNGFSAAIVSKLLGIPLVISLHGSDIFMADRNFLFRGIARWTFAQASHVTACSPELYERAKKIQPDMDIHLLAWGADPDKFKPIKNREDIRRKYGWDSSDIIVSALGRLVYKKGFDRLISAAAQLPKKEKQHLRVVIGGSGALEEQLMRQAGQLGLQDIVSFPGRIPWHEVPEFLAASDIFVLPSQRDKAGNLDGLPTVLLEAMACGLPCIASDIGGVSLVVEHEKNSIIVPPDDLEALKEHLSRLIANQDLRLALGTQSRQDILKTFNWEHVAAFLEGLFRESLSHQPMSRLGQLYRLHYLNELQKNIAGKAVLDIGCHDPGWLQTIDATQRIGVDLKPGPGTADILLVQADGFKLPFPAACFDMIFMLDVIEHVEEEDRLINEVKRVLKKGGRILLTTPSLDIRVFPSFLTGWVSHKWGHDYRRGYTKDALEIFFADFTNTTILKWRAFYYRNFYFILRTVFAFSPKLAEKIIRYFVKKESKKPYGDHGFLVLEARK